MKRMTIYDVAQKANVSLATVSRVINGSSAVREDTRLKVEKVIRELNYHPNAVAQGLALQKTTTIALVVPNNLSLTGQIISGLTDVAKIYKYNILLNTMSEGFVEIEEILENIIKSHVDGIIIFNERFSQKNFELLDNFQIPIVVIGEEVTIPTKVGSVYVNYKKLITDLVENYLANGKGNIAFVEDRKNAYFTKEIVAQITKIFKNHGKTFDGLINIPPHYRSSYQYLHEYFKDHRHDVVITYRDSQAIATVNAANEHSISIPDEMEVVCILDSKYNGTTRPAISGFKIPDYDLGAVAMRLLTKMLEKSEEKSEEKIELSAIFKKRDTTKEN